jgi:hypothetical protein
MRPNLCRIEIFWHCETLRERALSYGFGLGLNDRYATSCYRLLYPVCFEPGFPEEEVCDSGCGVKSDGLVSGRQTSIGSLIVIRVLDF